MSPNGCTCKTVGCDGVCVEIENALKQRLRSELIERVVGAARAVNKANRTKLQHARGSRAEVELDRALRALDTTKDTDR